MITLFNKLIEVREISHQIHLLKSGTQSNHEALSEFYKELLLKLDLMIETYQGQFGLIDNFGDFNKVDFEDHIKYFEDFGKYINESHELIVGEARHLSSILDEISIITYKLIFKLRNLT